MTEQPRQQAAPAPSEPLPLNDALKAGAMEAFDARWRHFGNHLSRVSEWAQGQYRAWFLDGWAHGAALSPSAPSATKTELGCAGHFIAARSCAWRRHTQVGEYRISSVGDYQPRENGKRETIGAGDDAYFETYVFRTSAKQSQGNEGCGCHEVIEWAEIDGERYATAGDAQAGHERYVAKYAALPQEAAPEAESR